MNLNIKYVIYKLNRVMGNENYLALTKVEFQGYVFNCFENEDDAIEQLIDNNMKYEDYIILKQVYIN